ncbi:hypothetical protein GOBAR_AA35544 [Gossypium barbadense]|uniref:USP domain-containing protein n=1 Tax=Gossypium barbadense TaxID=3634 RepID=A0A2P5W225_GOSBA|nr:hypothetical protein GOBAR_AA35544 [Gossypium barbadense]
MHVGGITLDLNWFLQFIFTLFIFAFVALRLLKNTASKYFEVDANFDRDQPMPSIPMDADHFPCAVCSNPAFKKCSRCKSVRYSSACQQVDWKDGHKTKCKVNSTQTTTTKPFSGVALVPVSGTSKIIKKPRKVLFPYDEFVKLFNWEKPGFPPCGLLNCGNSCFANVVLQCLVSTRPLVAYLLEKGHRKECRRNDWCFMCEFQTHVERSRQSLHPFSPINILSRLPNIGGNLGYGRQEDAHEFMRFAIDTMQSVCLDEFGGEKAVDRNSQETTLIQHIFGGHLQSQVICTNCNKISNQYENMMDLTVEIHGDASSLEECLDQFTVREWLHGDNMYKCDGCNDYVKAWKRLTIRWAPNILTIALKRFQSGRFGKLNKRVSFPETLDLSPYMSESEDGDDSNIYKLYAVVVHVDMLNASFFGHYICYTKDFSGNWYRIDDCKKDQDPSFTIRMAPKGTPVVVNMDNPSYSVVEIDDPDAAFKPMEKTRGKNPKQVTWVLLLKAHRAVGRAAWIATLFWDLLGTIKRRLIFRQEVAMATENLHIPSDDDIQGLLHLVYVTWLPFRADYIAPLIQALSKFCIALFLVQSEDRFMLSLGCFWIKYKKIKPKIEGDPFESVDVEECSYEYPMGLVQIPMCNEREVYEQSISAVCQLDWPKDRLLIQAEVATWSQRGINIIYCHRLERTGYKAGNLKSAMSCEYVKAYEFDNPELRLVQARWAFVNKDENLLTRLQNINLCFHFEVEQQVNGVFLNFFGFNGTAGVWRIKALEESGGWLERTTVEDMDIAIRAHLNELLEQDKCVI